MFRNRLERIKFVLSFLLLFLVILLILKISISGFLISFIYDFFNSIFSSNSFVDLNNFIFVSECSGIVSISAYLSGVINFYLFRVRLKIIRVIYFVIFLFLINLIRIYIVLLTDRFSLIITKVSHVLFWFLIGFFIFYFLLKTRK